jgi:hypothetical protein
MADVEFDLRIIEINEQLQENIQRMLSEGWSLTPGHKAVAIYPVQRIKQQPLGVLGVTSTMGIDESKISILRDGKIVG